MSLANRYGGARLEKEKEKQKKTLAIRKSGRKINKKEAKKLKAQDISKKDIDAARKDSQNKLPVGMQVGKLSRGAERVYNPSAPKRSAPKPAPAKSPAPSAAASSTPSTPSTPYSSQINTLASDMMSQQQQFDQRYGQPQSDFQNMMIQFRDQANERALAAEKMYQDMMISQQQAEARAAEERAAAQRRAEITQRTSMANQMRAASASPQLKLGSSESDRNMYGTSQFKRRSDIVSSVAKGIQNRLGNTLGGINV